MNRTLTAVAVAVGLGVAGLGAWDGFGGPAAPVPRPVRPETAGEPAAFDRPGPGEPAAPAGQEKGAKPEPAAPAKRVGPELKAGEVLVEGARLDRVAADDRLVSVSLGPAAGGPARTLLVNLPVAKDAEVALVQRRGTRMSRSPNRHLSELTPGMTATLLLTVRDGRPVVTSITGQVEPK